MSSKEPDIMVGIMIKNAEQWLDDFTSNLMSLSYPHNKLRLVFIYGDSNDHTLDKIKDFKNKSDFKIEVYKEPRNNLLKLYGTHAAGCIIDDFQNLMNDNEDYFLMMDTHMCEFPDDYIERLLNTDADIVAPYVWNEANNYFYDTWSFRIDNARFSPKSPPLASFPFEVDSVGTSWLAAREPFLLTPVNINILSFFYNARSMGYDIVTNPKIEVKHVDLLSHGIVKLPPPRELGYYPDGWVDNSFPLIPYEKRSKDSYYRLIYDNFRTMIEINALNEFNSNPVHTKKGLEWCYKFHDMNMFFCTADRTKIKIMYTIEMYPRYIEVELSNICPFKCRMCERTYLDEEPRLMSWKEFLLIMNNFPDLAQMSFTGIGEAWTNPIFLDCIRYIKERGVFFEQYDNMQFITKKRAEKLVKYGVERIIISLDAATKETYENLRVGHKWDKMLDGLRHLQNAKKKLKSVYPSIGIHFVINKFNQHEALKAIELAKQLNLDFVFYNRLLHKYPEVADLYMEIPDSLRQDIIEKANEEGVRVSINQPALGRLPPLNRCVALFQPFFLVNGDVITCCAQHEGNRRRWEQSMRMGNIFEAKDFRKIWYGPRYRHLRQLLIQNRLPEYCIDCPVYEWRGHKVYKAIDEK